MNQKNDSQALLVKQVRSHVGSLCDLLGCESMTAAPGDVIERGKTATRMMAGTFSLMGCSEWAGLLTEYGELLAGFGDRGLAWDDRIAQVTSELIDREEAFTGSLEENCAQGIAEVVPPEELAPLREEIAALLEMVETGGRAADTTVPNGGGGDDLTPDTRSTPPPPDSGPPMTGVVAELANLCRTVTLGLESETFRSRDWKSAEIAGIREQLCFLEFYIGSIQQMIGRNHPPHEMQTCGLAPLRTVLTDYASEVSESGGRTLDITLAGEETKIDPRLLPVAGSILQHMITDVFNRTENELLSIRVDVYESSGALRWQVCDNGDNFISDSQLDHEDQLAFYPGLRTVRRLLARHHGLLWVEPREDHEVRFEFSLPALTTENSILSWGAGSRAFGVRSVQLCDLLPAATAQRGSDSFGEFLTIHNKRVPLIKLDVLFPQGPAEGDNIAVIGSLERRIAFYVPGSGAMVDGTELAGVVPFWQGPPHVVAQVGEKRLALLDADLVIEEYLNRTGDMNNDEESGGVVEDESRESNGQAKFDSEINTPPDHLTEGDEGGDVEVLVVEQSDTLRALFAEILEKSRIKAAYAADVDRAKSLIQTRAPRLIISEFRMPTMAAKVLVDTMQGEDRAIPVLVTTSQSGKTADLLVEKLGVAGYLSKPLDQEEIVSRVNGYLSERVQT